MKFYIQKIQPEKINGVMRAEAPQGLLGDFFWECPPGEFCFGYSFTELQQLGLGGFSAKKEEKE